MIANDQVYIVIKGMPRTFTELEEAEEYAIENARISQEDHIVTLVPRERLERAIVARYEGVKLYAYEEARDSDH